VEGLAAGSDGRLRCSWGLSTPDYVDYHDTEWGRVVRGDDALFERMTLEAFQSGLSWITILRKRAGFRAAFANFSIPAVAAFDEADVARLMADAGIVRNRAKIDAVIGNARAVAVVDDLDAFLWSFVDGETVQNRWREMAEIPPTTDASTRMSKELRQRGFRFVGPTICYAFMQSAGLVNDHLVRCFRHAALRGTGA
jgi:DNA-3-methyladenine glycosylase I